VAEGFSRFSRLLDANFDAMHGSFASVLRLLDVAGEFFYVFKTFAIFQMFYGSMSKLGNFIRWLLFGTTTTKKLTQGNKSNSNSALEFTDYMQYQQKEHRRRLLPLFLIILGISFVGAPMLLVKLLKLFKRQQLEGPEGEQKALENVWNPSNSTPIPEDPNQPLIGQAVADFRGSPEMELSFNKDDQILVLAKPYPDWWEGEIQGRRGLFPANFVRLIKPTNKVEILPTDDPNQK